VLNTAIPRLFHPESTKTEGMIVFAIIGIVINSIAVIRLRQSKNMNSRIVTLHLFEDVLGWLAILIVSIIITYTELYVLDPILSIIITIYILYNVFRNLKKTIELFLQAVPDSIDLKTIENDLNSINHVLSTHHTHVWSLDGEHHVISTHIVIDEQISKEDLMCIREEIKQKLRQLNFSHSTVEFEFGDKDCMIS
jgi:cobalt-zinc-cadmium efflux system protein